MAKSEKRAVHMQGVRERILTTAEELFLSQGYKNTTIRQIVQKSGITSGSIYNIFEDKEHLFSALVDKFMDIVRSAVNRELKDEDEVHRFIALVYVELYCAEASPVIREMMMASHTSPILMEDIIARHEKIARSVWDLKKHEDDFSAALLLAEGTVTAYLISFDFIRKQDPAEIRLKILSGILQSFAFSGAEIGNLLQFIGKNKELWQKITKSILPRA
ncbi:TetR/AcrR family transcriptional regulator [Dialister sp.]|uniref:TetR/AcrR family transcriptional regulator n=1 Tax=Dialister sp. TaxID=1955814 RepID=UPI002E824701|nr:TetR/AcrR family transcriptional regulator [Dialister sp.]MEE3452734.1 TetR/AcrR family transcriptional regulator [Dialister sp.]